MFRCHIGEQHVRIKGLVIKAYGFKRDSKARLERTAFLDFFLFFLSFFFFFFMLTLLAPPP